MAGRTLHVRCSTWDQVEVFTTRKLRKGKLLSMKVPFAAKVGAQMTIGLELPNQVVVAIDGIVQKSAPVDVDGKPDPNRTWIEIELVGYTDDVKAQLAAMRGEPSTEEETRPEVPPIPEPRKSTPSMGDDLPNDERELFQHLTAELRKMRSAAVHDVLGVPRDSGPALVRTGWKDLIRRHHPDLVARRNAPAITHLAEELTILANRAYDRMRAALVTEGRGTVAGPAVDTPPGWLVAFDDLQSGDKTPAPRRAPNRFERPQSANDAIPAPQTQGQGHEFEQRARTMLGQGDANTAREVLAAALVVYPRSKPLRSLYYVATALAALQDGELMLATAQLETALAHHEQCVEAARVLEHIRRHGTADTEVVRRVFQ